MRKIRWGIIGAGDVTEVKSGPAFNKVENSEIVMVMRRNLEKAKDYSERHKIAKFTNDADDILNNPEIDAVYIATPPSSHSEYAIKSAKAARWQWHSGMVSRTPRREGALYREKSPSGRLRPTRYGTPVAMSSAAWK